MALPKATIALLWPLLGLVVAAWVVELVGLIFLQRSCGTHERTHHHHGEPAHWPQGAGLPDTSECGKIYRYTWWSIWYQFVLVAALALTLLRAPRAIRRFRIGLLALLANATSLHFATANEALNLTDTQPALSETPEEITRARVVAVGASLLAAFNILTIFFLGDDGDEFTGAANPQDEEEPLLNRQLREQAERASEQVMSGVQSLSDQARSTGERVREQTQSGIQSVRETVNL